MKKLTLHTEICYLLGNLVLAFSCAFMTKADFGLSMVVAPAYLLHLKLSEFHSFFTFGVTEYLFQAFLLVLMIAVLRRFRLSYLFSFVTAVLYGYTLDGALFLIGLVSADGVWLRMVFYIIGLLCCSVGVSLMLHTYIAPEVYELIVKEVPRRYGFGTARFKTAYDLVSCAVAVILSFSFFGLWHFEGVKWGTLICALVNGFLIGKICAFLDRHCNFLDLLPLRRFFDSDEPNPGQEI